MGHRQLICIYCSHCKIHRNINSEGFFLFHTISSKPFISYVRIILDVYFISREILNKTQYKFEIIYKQMCTLLKQHYMNRNLFYNE